MHVVGYRELGEAHGESLMDAEDVARGPVGGLRGGDIGSDFRISKKPLCV